jgi:hypothetical protein
MVGLGKDLAGFRARLRVILAIRGCLGPLVAWTMVWAFLVLALRAGLGADRGALVWGWLGYVPAIAAGVLLAVRRIPSPGALRAALDRHGDLGGLLMAAGEREIGSWSGQMREAGVPVVRWRLGRYKVLLPAAAVFLAASFLVPNRQLPFAGGDWLQVDKQVSDLSRKLEVLKQEQLIPAEKAQVLEKDLERVRQEASAKDPAKTMEAIDHLEQSFSKAAAEAAESAIKQAEKAGRAEKLAEALQKVQAQMPPEQLAEAVKELGRMTDEAAKESKSLAESLDQDLLDACEQGELTDQQLQQLADALGQCKNGQQAMLAKLVKARLVDGGMLGLLDGEPMDGGQLGLLDGDPSGGDGGDGGGDGELAALLAKCKDGADLAAALVGGLPGKGGPGGGGPPAAMTWSDEASKENTAFKEKVLPPAAVASLKDSRTIGISRADATADQPSGGSSGGALNSAAAGGGAARTQVILPEYEKTVRRYFDREKRPSP